MAKIYYYLDKSRLKEQVFALLKEHGYNLNLQEITPDENDIWLTEGLPPELDDFIALYTF